MFDTKDVIKEFNNFLQSYENFRKLHGLNKEIKNKYEITTSLADKVGRICRQVKHFERNDPKSDWPHGLAEDIAGTLVYLILLKNSYDIDISQGVQNELEKAIEQHAK